LIQLGLFSKAESAKDYDTSGIKRTLIIKNQKSHPINSRINSLNLKNHEEITRESK